MTAIGYRLRSAIAALQERGLHVDHRVDGSTDFYHLHGEGYRATVTINSTRWLGIEFAWLGEGGKPKLTYAIDTDLYNLSHPKQQSFALDIENEIVGFLGSLADGAVRIGTVRGKPAMIVPKTSGCLLLVRGRFLTSGTPYDTLADAETRGVFAPLS